MQNVIKPTIGECDGLRDLNKLLMTLDTTLYKHFSFDLWLTLIKSHVLYKKKRDLLFRDFFEIESDIENVSKTIRYYDVLCNRISEKTGNHISFQEIYYLILGALEVDIEKISRDKIDEFYRESEKLFMEYKPDLMFPKINLLLQQILSEGKTMNILSNTAFLKGTTLRQIISHYGLSDFFSFQLYSDEMKVSKPNNQAFEYLVKRASQYQPISRNEIVHIGDNPHADYKGAIGAGLNAILINRS